MKLQLTQKGKLTQMKEPNKFAGMSTADFQSAHCGLEARPRPRNRTDHRRGARAPVRGPHAGGSPHTQRDRSARGVSIATRH